MTQRRRFTEDSVVDQGNAWADAEVVNPSLTDNNSLFESVGSGQTGLWGTWLVAWRVWVVEFC